MAGSGDHDERAAPEERADHDEHPIADLLAEAAEAAEGPGAGSGKVRRHVAVRLARAAAGFVLVGVGIALLPLPGPGWVVIVVGLSLLPFRWARRMVFEIRRRIPGIPSEGRIPPRTMALYGLVVAVVTASLVAFGGRLGEWFVSLGDPATPWG